MSDCRLFIVEVLGNPYIKTDRIDTHAVGIFIPKEVCVRAKPSLHTNGTVKYTIPVASTPALFL